MDKKYQIFISSTYEDLVEERTKVKDVILEMYNFPIGMEMFNAADENQWEIIKETIDSSDYYVLIIGKRYGSVIPEGNPDAGKSYTEKEYRYAVDKGIPVLTFIKREKAVTADKMDIDPDKISKLQKFVEEITSSREVDWFENIDELGTEVSLALYKQINRKKRPGWVRDDHFDVEGSLTEIVTLNKRIRELEEENKKLNDSLLQRTPKLMAKIQVAGTIGNPANVTESENNSISIQRQLVSSNGYIDHPQMLSLSDVPEDVKDLVNQDVINYYNSKLPQENEVEDYESKMHFYNEIQKNGQRLNFVIENTGTAKATDINIMFQFPDSFMIMKRKTAENYSEPTKPTIPPNPIDVARSQKDVMKGKGAELKSMFYILGKSIENENNTETRRRKIFSEMLNNDYSIYRSVEIEGQKVKIWSHDLLHTNSAVFDDFCIIPKQKGTFNVKVTMICEEYIHKEESNLEIVVE